MKKLFLIDAHGLIYRSYYAFIRSPRINSKGLNTCYFRFCKFTGRSFEKRKAFSFGRSVRS